MCVCVGEGKACPDSHQGRRAALYFNLQSIPEVARVCLQPFGGNILIFNSHVSNLTEIEKCLINSEPLKIETMVKITKIISRYHQTVKKFIEEPEQLQCRSDSKKGYISK